MDKILIELYVPAIEEYYDLFVPDFLSVDIMSKLLGNAVRELSENRYISSGEELLCDQLSGKIFIGHQTFKDYNIQNGDRVMMC